MDEFRPTYLYIKQCNVTGLKYFGKTVTKNPIKYKGSGTYWLRHIKKYNNDVTTVWYQLFTNKDELVEFATNFSIDHNIVESVEWANLKIEDGLRGGGVKGIKLGAMSESHKQKIRESVNKTLADLGRTAQPKEKSKKIEPKSGWEWSESSKEKLSAERKGRVPWNKGKSVGSYASNRQLCPHCNKNYAPYTFKRWHGDKCKVLLLANKGSDSC